MSRPPGSGYSDCGLRYGRGIGGLCIGDVSGKGVSAAGQQHGAVRILLGVECVLRFVQSPQEREEQDS